MDVEVSIPIFPALELLSFYSQFSFENLQAWFSSPEHLSQLSNFFKEFVADF